MSKEVTLTTGKVVTVYAPPVMKIMDMLEVKYPPVEKKTVTEKTVAGEVTVVIDDDPQYLADVEARDKKVSDESQELYMLFALKDERVPDGWDVEVFGHLLRYTYPEWEPREGALGRKLDWIEWDLLGNPADAGAVQIAINEQISIPQEVVQRTLDSFPDQVEG